MTTRRLVAIGTIVLAAGACTAEGILGSPDAPTYAVAAPTCGPADGPAVAIYLAEAPVDPMDPAPPYVRVVVWQPLDLLATRSWTLNDGDEGAAAWYYSGAQSSEVGASGEVRVTAVRADSTVEGTVELRFPVAGRVAGRFRATWVPLSLRCG
jgi:hypothetical protein